MNHRIVAPGRIRVRALTLGTPATVLAMGTLRVAILAAVLLCAALPSVARALDFAVTTTVDAADAAPGDGVCADAAGPCTLRAAIEEANMFAGVDALTVPAGTYQTAQGDPRRVKMAAHGHMHQPVPGS